MTHLTITRPDTAQAYIDEQLASGTYSSADELLTVLIEDAQERHAKQKVNAMLRSPPEKIKRSKLPTNGGNNNINA